MIHYKNSLIRDIGLHTNIYDYSRPISNDISMPTAYRSVAGCWGRGAAGILGFHSEDVIEQPIVVLVREGGLHHYRLHRSRYTTRSRLPAWLLGVAYVISYYT